MLYQLSYLGPWLAALERRPYRTANPQSTRGSQAASGDGGGSSSNSSGGPAIRYCSPNQRPRSTSAHRGEQNGRCACNGAWPQIGQRGGDLTMRSLNTPAVER